VLVAAQETVADRQLISDQEPTLLVVLLHHFLPVISV
jgi:hypothetical protein